MSVTVLLADEDPPPTTVSTLVDAGIDVVEAGSLAAARDLLDDTIDCVVVEARLPDGDGLALLEAVRTAAPDTPCIVYTDAAPGDIDTAPFQGLVAEFLPKRGGENVARLRTLVDELVTRRSQVGYPLPTDEDARLAALDQYDVDNDAIRATFDRLTELAASHIEVDKAFIGVVGEHEEQFVACHEADLAPLERENTMCTHAILEEDVMVVEDVNGDRRFEHNDALERLNIRSYVGAPMRASDGMAIGSFCLTHDEPRTYTDDELRFLRLLADEAMEQLELRRQLAAAPEGST